MIEAAQRVIDTCREIASFSEQAGCTTRTFLCPQMQQCHELLQAWMNRLGMESWVDAAGNLRGFYGGATPHAARLAIGSHLDTVPDAGAFDGVLGVVLGVALVELLGGRRLPFGIEVLGFSEEEGVRFGAPFLGSQAYTGTLSPAMLEVRDASGVTVADAIRHFGLDPGDMAKARFAPSTRAYLEIHIEQGPVLESMDLGLGIVSEIVGQSRASVSFRGAAGHAGTTPHRLRRDALAGAAEWILTIEQRAGSEPGLLATVGKMAIAPNAGNVIPGFVELSLDVRHANDRTRERSFDALIRAGEQIALRRDLVFQNHVSLQVPACPLHEGLTSLLAESVQSTGSQAYRMPSGAGHDAMIVAPYIPAAMLFVRSPRGISHHPGENVIVDDVALALQAGSAFLERLSACHFHF